MHKSPVAILAVTAVAALAACVAPEETRPQKPAAEIVFPPPPDEPRLAFERTIFSTASLHQDDSTSRLRRLVTGEQITGRGFGKPFDVAACKGTVFVSDSTDRMVVAFDVPRRRAFEIGLAEPGALAQPLGLNTDDNCNLYVADATAKQVLIYDREGRFLRKMGGPDLFNRLSHVAASPDGKEVFAVDTGGIGNNDHRIRVFDALTGEHLRDIGKRGKEPGSFNLPRDVEVGKDNNVYVVDGANFRVQVFSLDGKLVRVFGDVGRQTGQFSRPKGIALDPEGRVYVSDAAFGNFQIFTPEGQLLLFVGSRGSRPNPATYMLPAGIDVDEDGRIYMVDQFFRKVDVFRPVGLAKEAGFLGAWHKPAAN
jgi:DNA-binding beta-propeller fold protein YncE